MRLRVRVRERKARRIGSYWTRLLETFQQSKLSACARIFWHCAVTFAEYAVYRPRNPRSYADYGSESCLSSVSQVKHMQSVFFVGGLFYANRASRITAWLLPFIDRYLVGRLSGSFALMTFRAGRGSDFRVSLVKQIMVPSAHCQRGSFSVLQVWHRPQSPAGTTKCVELDFCLSRLMLS